ncbi:hypothetical protein BCR36DRAFT_372623 [Piromyces finnis]|uniref:ARM repeat-containing protein n=1 Tax=Piromyces finnis TaxID=1754191 RepID=A0A1Y1V235_9FUNG|nr:hypothetical protein BCR36DRAFT_372623 [Piromyces finnis]|eukprot:ORX45570.1 hypothetical protein BCR36DRAFT_372623 [Piromyces finnis]
MNNQVFQESFNQNSFYSNVMGAEAFLKGDTKPKNMHNRSQSVFSSLGQNNGFNTTATNSTLPFSSSSLNKEMVNLGGQAQFNNTANLLNESTLLGNQINVESNLARERPLGAGHRYNSHSVNFLPMMNMSNAMNTNSGTSWGSPTKVNQVSMNSMTTLNQMDLNNSPEVAANLLNTVAADRLVNPQTQSPSSSHLSEMNANFLDSSNDELAYAALSSLNKKSNEKILNTNELLKGYSFTNKNISSPLVDSKNIFSQERPSSVLSNHSTSSNNNVVPSPFAPIPNGTIEDNRVSNVLAANLLNNGQVKSPFQRSPLLTHKPKASSVSLNYLEMSPKPQLFSPNHRRGASFNLNIKKMERNLLNNNGIVLDKNEKEDDEDSKMSLTLNSSYSNEILLSPEIENLPELQQLENDEETLVESPTTLYVEYLDHSLSTKDLKPYFTKFGEIESLKLDSDKDVAFVKYKNPKDASKAKNEMNGKMIKTSEIQITFYSHSPESVDETVTIVSTPTRSLWISNIPASLSLIELKKKFSKFGSIETTRLLPQKTSGSITFENLDEAVKAFKKMNGLEINGSVLKVSYIKAPESLDSESVKSLSTQFTEKSKDSEKSKKKSEKGKKDLPQLTIPITTEYLKSSDDEDGEYFATIPTLSEHATKRQVDQNKLKEMRKKLEGHTTAKEIESYFNTIMLDVVGLCTDYIGNVIVQKVLDHTSDENRLKLIKKLSPHLATVGIHKNGTWVVQKIIDEAKGPVQIQYIVDGLKKYTPPLLLDQFGNYVIQCCLRLGTQNNQFIFDAIVAKCKDIGPGRFGARAIRACLESQHTTKRQQKQVAMAIVRCATDLCVNPNGALLITWLLDTSSLPGRFRVIAPKLVPNIASFCSNKLASSTILKLVNQRVEMDARSTIIKSIFYQGDAVLKEILSNPAYGVSVIQKILASACINNEEKIQLADRVRTALSQLTDIKPNQVGYKRLFEELGIIPTTKNNLNPSLFYNNAPIDIVSPLTPTTPMSSFFSNFTADPNPTPSTNSMIPSMIMNEQQQQQQQQQQSINENLALLQQQQRALETLNFQNSYLSVLNNTPSLKYGQSQGYNNNSIFNNPALLSEGSPSQFNASMFQNNVFQQKQQLNPYSLLMNGGSPSFNNYYNNFGNQINSQNMNQSTMKSLNMNFPSSSSSIGISKMGISPDLATSSIKMKGHSKNSPQKLSIQIPSSSPLSLSMNETTSFM